MAAPLAGRIVPVSLTSAACLEQANRLVVRFAGSMSSGPLLRTLLTSVETSRSAMPLAGKGFIDTTRIASGDARLWRDILLDNRDNVLTSLTRLQNEIATLKKLITPTKGEALTAWLASAAQRRDDLAKAKLREIADE